jgi:hypothetical protein
VWKIILSIREWNIGERESRTKHIGFSQSVKEVWEGQGSVRGSVLKKEGRLRERIIGKATVLTPGDDVDSGRESYTVSVGSELPDPSSIIVSYKGHFNRKPGVLTG